METNLPIIYDRNIPLGVVSDDPSTFLVLDQLFDNFRIITNNRQEWLYELEPKAKIDVLGANVKQSGIAHILRSKKFFEYAKAHPKVKYVLYSPLDPPYKVNPLACLMNSPAIGHAYENKRYFRDEFADLVRIPEYEVMYVNQLDRAAAYSVLKDKYGSFVLQDEESSGSKGTYIVHNQTQYLHAVDGLKKFSQGRSVVVSKFVKGITASIQACVTKYGIFSGGVQRQIVDNHHLCNVKLSGATRFCGGELGGTFPEIVQMQAREIASILGSELGRHGYKGVFGIDLLITPQNEVYAIEINARLTAYTHLLSDLQLAQGKIPFLLLHILEVGNYDYEVTDLEALPSIMTTKRTLSFLILNNPYPHEYIMPEQIKTGVYTIENGELVFQRPGFSVALLENDDEVIISSRYNQDQPIISGKRILKVVKYGKSMGKNDLNKKAVEIIDVIKQRYGVVTPEA